MDDQVTNKDILEAIQLFSHDVDGQFSEVKKEITFIKSTMASKDFVTEKLFDLKRILSLEPFPSLM